MSASSVSVIDQAVDWLVLLWSGEADDAQREAWRRWRAASPEHERAWQHIESMDTRLRHQGSGLTATAALSALNAPVSASRRRALNAVVALAMVGGGVAGGRALPWNVWTADVQVARAERRHVTLADGTQLLINSDSVVDLRFDEAERVVVLHRGEIQAVTAPDVQRPARPFRVETSFGSIRPIGTRFVVRGEGDSRGVAVTKGAVELHAGGGAEALRINAGQALRFTSSGAAALQPIGTETAWVDGVLVTTDTRLQDVIAELARYHPMRLSCAPEVAELRVSGVFPLDDPERALQALTDVLPIRQRRLAGIWIRVMPA